MFIINENFHYFIGEPFVDLTGMEDDEAYQLIGSYIPVKSLVFDQFEQFLAPQSEQRRDLSRYLGRAAYNFHKVWDWQKTEWLTARRFTIVTLGGWLEKLPTRLESRK